MNDRIDHNIYALINGQKHQVSIGRASVFYDGVWIPIKQHATGYYIERRNFVITFQIKSHGKIDATSTSS